MVDQIDPPRRVSSMARGSNRGRLVEVLRRQGPLPRVELARSTGLSFPAISGLTSRLIAEELLCEAETETAATSWSDRLRTALQDSRSWRAIWGTLLRGTRLAGCNSSSISTLEVVAASMLRGAAKSGTIDCGC